MPTRSPRGRASSAPVSELTRNSSPSCPESSAALTTRPASKHEIDAFYEALDEEDEVDEDDDFDDGDEEDEDEDEGWEE